MASRYDGAGKLGFPQFAAARILAPEPSAERFHPPAGTRSARRASITHVARESASLLDIPHSSFIIQHSMRRRLFNIAAAISLLFMASCVSQTMRPSNATTQEFDDADA